jgi:hypothetical protein
LRDNICLVLFCGAEGCRGRLRLLVPDRSLRSQIGMTAEEHVRTHLNAPIVARRLGDVHRTLVEQFRRTDGITGVSARWP